MASEQEGNEAGSPTISRRDMLKAGAAGAAGLGAASLLGPGAIAKAAPAQRRAGAKTVLNLMSWEPYNQPGEFPAWTKVVNEFMAANPNIEVKWTGWPFATYLQNVIEQAQTGQVAADVVMCTPELATTLITNYNLCEPIGQIATSLGLIPNNSHNQFMVNGQLYALGVIQVAYALRYDKRLLKQAGFNAPPTTPAEWLAQSKALTKTPTQFANNLYNTIEAADGWWNTLQNFCLPYDGVWATGKTLTINSPANVKGVQFYVDLVNASGLKGTVSTVIDKLAQTDRVAFMFDVSLGAVQLKIDSPKLYPNLRTVAPPWPSRKAISRLHPLVILKTSKNQAAAHALVEFMVQPKNLWYVTEQNGYPNCPYSNFGKFVSGYDAFEKSTPWYTGFTTTNYVGEGDIFGEYSFAYSQFGHIIQGNLEKVFTGSSTVKEALDASQVQAVASLPKP
jgi:ABC-type glycerol-3-phosphate transport system substrate-binding protein